MNVNAVVVTTEASAGNLPIDRDLDAIEGRTHCQQRRNHVADTSVTSGASNRRDAAPLMLLSAFPFSHEMLTDPIAMLRPCK
jgi:hypothetical protein